MNALGKFVALLGVVLAVASFIAARKKNEYWGPLLAWAMACTVAGSTIMSISSH